MNCTFEIFIALQHRYVGLTMRVVQDALVLSCFASFMTAKHSMRCIFIYHIMLMECASIQKNFIRRKLLF